MKYDVLSTPDLDELCKWVNEKLKKGWQLQGGVATMVHPPRYTVFYQAMIKEEKSTKTPKKATRGHTDINPKKDLKLDTREENKE